MGSKILGRSIDPAPLPFKSPFFLIEVLFVKEIFILKMDKQNPNRKN